MGGDLSDVGQEVESCQLPGCKVLRLPYLQREAEIQAQDGEMQDTTQQLMHIYQNAPVEQILLFKEQVNATFQYSTTANEAYQAGADLLSESWWRSSYHLPTAIRSLVQPNFQYYGHLPSTSLQAQGGQL